MRILVASCFIPFEHSPQRAVADRLAAEVRATGAQAEVVGIPLDTDPSRQAEHALAIRLFDLVASSERLVCVGAPAALLRHPDKRAWLIDDDALGAGSTAAQAMALREAVAVGAAPGPPEHFARRAGIYAFALSVPGPNESWQHAVAALTT